MKTASKVIVGVIILAVIIAIAAFSFSGNATKERTVRIGYLPIMTAMPLFVAQEKGFFADEGVTVEAIPVQTSNQMTEALIRGDIDFSVDSSQVPTVVAETIDPGKIKIFSMPDRSYPDKPFDSILVAKGSPIHSLKDLEGKRLGVHPGSTATAMVGHYLKGKGIDISTITFVPLTPATQLGALTSGSIDALHALEPTIAIAVDQDVAEVMYGSIYAQLVPGAQAILGGSSVSTDFLEKEPALARKTIRALDKANQFVLDHESEARKVLPSHMKLSDTASEKVVLAYKSPTSQMDFVKEQKFLDLLYQLGEIKQPIRAEDILYRSS